MSIENTLYYIAHFKDSLNRYISGSMIEVLTIFMLRNMHNNLRFCYDSEYLGSTWAKLWVG
jgi:hypothetical protein